MVYKGVWMIVKDNYMVGRDLLLILTVTKPYEEINKEVFMLYADQLLGRSLLYYILYTYLAYN